MSFFYKVFQVLLAVILLPICFLLCALTADWVEHPEVSEEEWDELFSDLRAEEAANRSSPWALFG